MISEHPSYLYTILHNEFFENVERYRPSREYYDVAKEFLGDSWSLQTNGFWIFCTPSEYATIPQGWKIHLSATQHTATETLQRTAPIFAEMQVGFKFCADTLMLNLSNSKNWSRTGSGKFIAAYPQSQEQFLELIERLHLATTDLKGPYILTDRPYQDSKVVFYRYGEHLGERRLVPDGRAIPYIQSPSGDWYADARVPYFRLPEGVSDPFGQGGTTEAPGDEGILLKNRYRAKRSVKFNGVGGIYLADDTLTGKEVFLREARPLLHASANSADAFELLRKEARILQKLEHTGYFPQFVDLFQEWEHLFLVQEKLEAESLWGYAINFTIGFIETTPRDSYRMISQLIRKLALGLRTVHRHGVVLRDLTKTNVMVTEDDKIKFIDLEFAYELDRDDPPVWGWTVGYASPRQMRNDLPSPEDDCFALGALILDSIVFMANGYALNREGVLRGFRLQLEDMRLPTQLEDIITGLTNADPKKRWTPDMVLARLDEIPEPQDDVQLFPSATELLPRPAPSAELIEQLEETVDGLAEFILDVGDYDRDDRLWPPSPEVFTTNSVQFEFGAAGTAFFLLQAKGELPSEAVNWISRCADAKPCPPGLFSGYSGVALLFLEMGRTERARELMEKANQPEVLEKAPGLYYGQAGWGLANLHFWDKTGIRSYLDQALEVGEDLLRKARIEKDGYFWDTEGEVHLGLGHGQSGIALFFLYLNAASPDDRFLQAALQAIDFDLANRIQVDDYRLLWYPILGSEGTAPQSPHMRYGTAGVASAVLRCYSVTQEPRLRKWLDTCSYSICRRQTNKLWQDYGLAGFGEVLIDMYRFLGDENALNNAFYLAEAILPLRIKRPRGVAFPGQELFRISCDFGMGSAGIGVFMHRLLNPHTPRALLLDEWLLADRAREGARESAQLVHA